MCFASFHSAQTLLTLVLMKPESVYVLQWVVFIRSVSFLVSPLMFMPLEGLFSFCRENLNLSCCAVRAPPIVANAHDERAPWSSRLLILLIHAQAIANKQHTNAVLHLLPSHSIPHSTALIWNTSQEVKLGPCIIPDEPVGKSVLENVACIKDPDGYMFEVGYTTLRWCSLRA